MATNQGVIIEQAKTGAQYAVSVADFKKHYEEQGFKIVSNEDGTPYEDPAKAGSKKDADKPNA